MNSTAGFAGASAQQVDTQACEREPIHAPGAIQPHGALLAAQAEGLLITHASANLQAILGRSVEAVLGRPLQEVLGEALCQTLRSLDGDDSQVRVDILKTPVGRRLSLRAYRSGSHICVDVEPLAFEGTQALPITMAQGVLESFRHAADTVALCEAATRGLKAITGYDRVIAYQFMDDGHGEVIAEAREPSLEPFLGLCYPASDVPPQARQLYLRQRVGAIADASYDPVRLLTHGSIGPRPALDLTRSALRSVSPVHLQYMRNMGTAASLTVGLAHGEQLWGMLVCHHATPRLAGSEVRAAADVIGQVMSLLLVSLEKQARHAQRLERQTTLQALVARLSLPVPLAGAVVAAEPELLSLLNAGGALVHMAGVHHALGRTPCPPAANRALALLQRAADGEMLALSDLPLRYPELTECEAEGSGVLLLPLASGPGDAILWFRPALSRTVEWAGDPTRHVSQDPATGRLSPRSSFSAWKETVRGRATPWSETEISLAREVGEALAAELARRTKTQLQESDQRFRWLAENSGVVLTLCDADGFRRYVSPASERVLGWRPEDLVGHRAVEFIHPEDCELLTGAHAEMVRSGESSACYRQRRPDGSWLWVDGVARLRPPASDGVTGEYVVVLRDATLRKTAELELRRALELTEQIATTDGLTGIANRRQIDTVSAKEWRRCAREKLPLSVLLVDADHFKRYNDQYGHLAGDDCLRAIAAQVKVTARQPGHLAGRYGGEEFLVLMPNTDNQGALQAATRLCNLVRALRLRTAGKSSQELAQVTVSVGGATAWPHASNRQCANVHDLLLAADAALYRAKGAGRDRVVMADL